MSSGLIYAIVKLLIGKYNNYKIFENVFPHVINGLPLYVEYPTEYFAAEDSADLNEAFTQIAQIITEQAKVPTRIWGQGNRLFQAMWLHILLQGR